MKFSRLIALSLLLGIAGNTNNACGATGEPAAAQLRSRTHERIEKYMRAHGVGGIAVVAVVGQDVLLAHGFGLQADGRGPYTAQTPCHLYSSTKALSSLVFASLVADGAFDLNKPLGEYLPDSPTAWREIPFWRLLNHSSGITDIVDKPEFNRVDSSPVSGNADVYEVLKRYPLDYLPGKYSRYRQSGYALAELIATRELRATWHDLVVKHVLEPAGAVNTFSTSLANGQRSAALLTAAGGYQTSAEDMSRIFMALNRGAIVAPEFLQELMYSDRYNFSGYSLGSILQTVGGIPTVGHEGGAARATIRYAPGKRVGVAVFTDQMDNNEVTLAISDMLIRELALGEETREPIAVPLFAMRSGPAQNIVAFFREQRSKRRQRYDFGAAERTLNRLGYMYLKTQRVPDAVSIFHLNTREHPNSANAHDSLGEAYFETADYERALASYERSLVLDPANHNATAMIERIRASRK